MRFAVFSDIHANIYGLRAVLADIDARGIQTLYCGGDLVGYAPFPNEVIELIRERQIPTVTGNYDDGVGHDRDDCGCAYTSEEAKALGHISLDWTKQRITPENQELLKHLPASITITESPFKVLLVHGTTRRINEYTFPDRQDKSLLHLLEVAEADIIVNGHIHTPYHRVLGNNKHWINAGSVGKPKTGNPDANYVIVTIEDTDVQVEIVSVPYDVEAAAQAVEEARLPGEFAHLLRTGGK